MPTPEQIQAALVIAQANSLSYVQMADLLRYAISAAMVSGAGDIEIPWNNVSANGVTISRMPITEAVALEIKYRSMDSGGIVPQLMEFSYGY